MDKVTKNYDKDGNYTGKSVEKEQYNQDYWNGVYGGHSDGPSTGSGGGGVGCVVAIVAAIAIFLLFFIALVVWLGGNANHWGFMLALLKIVWWPIKTLFVIVWFLVKIPFIIADKITVPGFLLIALAGIIIAIISGNKKNKKEGEIITPDKTIAHYDKDGKYTGIRKG